MDETAHVSAEAPAQERGLAATGVQYALPQRVTAPALADKLRRLAWQLIYWTCFRFTPAPLHGWRVLVLKAFGAKIGKGCSIYPDAQIWAPWCLGMEDGSCLGPKVICYSVASISLGAGSIVSQGAHLCSATHDIRNADFALMAAPIAIGAGAWIAAEAFLHAGVSVGEGAVVGARAVVARNVNERDIVAGNPACVVGRRTASRTKT